MVLKEVEEICEKIRKLEIQGARNVAKAAVKALSIQARNSKAENVDAMVSELLEAADALASTRPTEPMLRNALRNAVRHSLSRASRKTASVEELRNAVIEGEKNYFENVKKSISNIAEFGAKKLPEKGEVLLHCHSSTVVSVIKRAFEMGKEIRITCTETRPKYQGHITARECAKAGIPTRMIVDSAVKNFMQDIDVVLVGADAITATGDLVNKIGTSTIAAVARDEDVPFYCATEVFKFDSLTRWGVMEEIEERDPSEVADPKEFKGVEIRNPAFDVTRARYISAYITDLGIFPPQSLVSAVWREFPPENPLAKRSFKIKR